MLTTPAPLTQPNQVSPLIEANEFGMPSATVSPSTAPPTANESKLQEPGANCGRASDTVTDRCCLMGVPPPIVTAPAGVTWNCAAVPTASAAVSAMLPNQN